MNWLQTALCVQISQPTAGKPPDMADHNIRVVTLMTGEEYLAMKSMADEDGLSDSAFMRHLFRLEANKRALKKVSSESRAGESTEPAQVLHK